MAPSTQENTTVAPPRDNKEGNPALPRFTPVTHQEGPCHDPLPVVILLAALEYQDSAEDMDKGRVNTFKFC